MQAYITNIKIKGIKNIDKEISLDFYNKTLPKKFTLDNSNIKSIYGENGAGKSGIIHAIDIYKKITTTRNYLLDSNTINLLHELVNKKLQSFSITVSFLIILDEVIFSHLVHEIVIDKVNNCFEIGRERLTEVLKRKSKNGKELVILDIEKGIITNKSLFYDKKFIERSMNLLKSHSFFDVFVYEYRDYAKDIMEKGESNYEQYKFYISSTLAFISINEIHIYLSQDDRHDEYIYNLPTITYDDMEIILNEFPVSKAKGYVTHSGTLGNRINYVINEHTDRIHIKDKDNYLQRIQRLHEFLNIFKSNILNIEVEMKENKDYLICEKYFVYDGYRINVEFESTGIKKLIRLFDAFEKFVNGEIVFIDELDANIHDVYLIKLLEYFTVHAKGQLCFTTHNLGPMEILRKQKHAIDFLSNDARIVPWKKNGHYSVINLYREGMIENSPFNIEPIDFVGIFEEEEINGDTVDSGCGNES